MSIMADKNRRHPAFRLSEVMGPHHRRSFERSLSEELHRRFDGVAAEGLPEPLAALMDRLEPDSQDDAESPPRAS
jgi:hypothetical protein